MNGRASASKGKRGEQEIVRLYAEHLGIDARRTLWGHKNDIGDLTGVPDTVIEIKNMASLTAAVTDGLADLDKEWARTGHPYAVLWVKRARARTHPWVAVMTPEQHFAMWREAVKP